MLGLIGKKIGMTQIFAEDGVVTPVTVVSIQDNFIVDKRTVEKNGYSASVLGSVAKKKSRVTKPYAGQFPEQIEPTQYLIEVRDFEVEAEVGSKVGVELFNDCDYVDVSGVSKGKGFQGGRKRYGFKGGRKTHGSKFHNDLGGTGCSTTPGRTYKGRKMAGHMGSENVTVLNLEVVKIESEKGLLLVKGAVPGHKNGMVFVRKAVKK